MALWGMNMGIHGHYSYAAPFVDAAHEIGDSAAPWRRTSDNTPAPLNSFGLPLDPAYAFGRMEAYPPGTVGAPYRLRYTGTGTFTGTNRLAKVAGSDVTIGGVHYADFTFTEQPLLNPPSLTGNSYSNFNYCTDSGNRD